MVTMWQNQSLSLALGVATAFTAGARLVRARAGALASPSARRRVQEQFLRLITVVAGH